MLISVVAAHEILSILRKAKSEKDVATMKSLSIEGFHASESTSFFQSDSSCQRKEQLQDVCNEGSTTIHLDEENSPMQKDDSEISKDEATNEIHLVEISKSAEKGSENSPSFFLGCVYNKSLHKIEFMQCIDGTKLNMVIGITFLETTYNMHEGWFFDWMIGLWLH